MKISAEFFKRRRDIFGREPLKFYCERRPDTMTFVVAVRHPLGAVSRYEAFEKMIEEELCHDRVGVMLNILNVLSDQLLEVLTDPNTQNNK